MQLNRLALNKKILTSFLNKPNPAEYSLIIEASGTWLELARLSSSIQELMKGKPNGAT
jgi:hypothetical protein